MTKPRIITRLKRREKDLIADRTILMENVVNKRDDNYLRDDFKTIYNIEGQLEVIELVLKLYQ